MRLILATNHLGLGGSESYLITVAEQFDRLGHEVAIYSPEHAGGVAAARERGIEVIPEGEEPPADFDAALVQDAGVSYELREANPTAPQVFVAHSESFDLQAPPQLAGASVGVVVALNDRVADRARSYAAATEVVRLRQPIDTERFTPAAPLPDVARRALLLSNAPHADRLHLLEAACAEAGIELTRLGGRAGQTTDPQRAIAGAEIVIGYGRSILEGMACGRAAYVYDWHGGDGWMTEESYAAIEADGISGRGGRETITAERLAEDMRRYSPAMGPVNHDLVVAHHRANVHAQQLLELFRRLAPVPVPASPLPPLPEMARLVRLEWRARAEVHVLTAENAELHQRLHETEVSLREALAEGERRAAEAAAEVAASHQATLSWRVTRPLRALGDLLRRLLGRRPAGG